MKIHLLIPWLSLISNLLFAQEGISYMKWEEGKKPNEPMIGKLLDANVASASSANEEGVREIQFVLCPGTDEKIMVTTTKSKDSKEFNHSVNVPKNFPFQVQIEAGPKKGSLVVIVVLKDGSLRRFYTNPEKNLIGLSH